MSDRLHRSRTLGISPVKKGFAFAVLEGSDLIAWGTRGVAEGTPERSMDEFRKLMRSYHPARVALEDASHPGARRHRHIRHLLFQFRRQAQEDKVRVRQIILVHVLRARGPRVSKWTVAAELATRFPQLADRLPAKRKITQSERPRMAIFVALAFAIHYDQLVP